MIRKSSVYFFAALGLFLILIFDSGCSTYDKKQFNNGELYYNTSVSGSIVDSLGNYFNECQIFTEGVKKGRLTKAGNIYELSLSVPENKIKDSSYTGYIEVLATQLSEDIFNKSPVKIFLTDDNFNTKLVKTSMKE